LKIIENVSAPDFSVMIEGKRERLKIGDEGIASK
jgi:hypothetical protein